MNEPTGYADVRRVMVGTDRSDTADEAVQWAVKLAELFGAELVLVQVVGPTNPVSTEFGAAERTRATAVEVELANYARQIAGERGHARVLIDDDPAMAIVRAAEHEKIDVLVVGNKGMAGRKEFLLGNVPNRISHNARSTVVIVNTFANDALGETPIPGTIRHREPEPTEPHLLTRSTRIAAVMAKYGLRAIFGESDLENPNIRREQARQLRAALEELGPTYSKLGQVMSTRPDLLPAEYIEELTLLQDHVAPMPEEEVVRVTEIELGVPWEDVFESIDAQPLAAGTIAQVHRAQLANGERVVMKVQRPKAREEIEQDLALLEIFAERVGRRPSLNKMIDMESVFKHLSASLQRELDFRQEAENIERMRTVLKGYNRLAVPGVHRELSTSRLLILEEIQGIAIAQAPAGPARIEAARQLMESYYKQIIVDGFFHADPHPGNLMWWKDRIYFLDFGMVGVVSAEIREHLMLMLMALWQEDAEFLTDVTLIMTGVIDRAELDVFRLQEEIAEVMTKYRSVVLAEMQIGPIFQEMSGVAMRNGIPLPASLTLAAKALAQVQVATANLDPKIDPFEVAGKFLMRWAVKRLHGALSPKTLIYGSQKFKVRATRVLESLEHLVGARPGQKLAVNVRGSAIENTLRHAGRRVALGLTAGAAGLATALTLSSTTVAPWVPLTFGSVAGLLTLGLILDLLRGN